MAKVWNLAFWRDAPPGTEGEGVVLESAGDEPGDESADDEDGGATGSGSGFPAPAGAVVSAGFLGRSITTTKRLPWPMLVATGAAVALGLLYTVLGGPLTTFTDAAAAELLARAPYIEAVLGR
ncbi:hypothetical protein FM21_16475 [Streptomyces mutabilis]|uniref:Uncharacterized protein n=1 Tax=Streptomyces mutabilis TaxID=67332 RepID=A0A086MUD8_9ACTN|nr:hypothetical protein FM21_16475 [Streptomyces mutabilis]